MWWYKMSFSLRILSGMTITPKSHILPAEGHFWMARRWLWKRFSSFDKESKSLCLIWNQVEELLRRYGIIQDSQSMSPTWIPPKVWLLQFSTILLISKIDFLTRPIRFFIVSVIDSDRESPISSPRYDSWIDSFIGSPYSVGGFSSKFLLSSCLCFFFPKKRYLWFAEIVV